jgi:hypothetical protein
MLIKKAAMQSHREHIKAWPRCEQPCRSFYISSRNILHIWNHWTLALPLSNVQCDQKCLGNRPKCSKIAQQPNLIMKIFCDEYVFVKLLEIQLKWNENSGVNDFPQWRNFAQSGHTGHVSTSPCVYICAITTTITMATCRKNVQFREEQKKFFLWFAFSRVTRLGEFSPFGQLFSLDIFCTIFYLT